MRLNQKQVWIVWESQCGVIAVWPDFGMKSSQSNFYFNRDTFQKAQKLPNIWALFVDENCLHNSPIWSHCCCWWWRPLKNFSSILQLLTNTFLAFWPIPKVASKAVKNDVTGKVSEDAKMQELPKCRMKKSWNVTSTKILWSVKKQELHGLFCCKISRVVPPIKR